jgi:hypothetical protein
MRARDINAINRHVRPESGWQRESEREERQRDKCEREVNAIIRHGRQKSGGTTVDWCINYQIMHI